MDRLFAAPGAGSALVAVAAGAFGAHALRALLAPHQLAAFETGARYQMYHARVRRRDPRRRAVLSRRLGQPGAGHVAGLTPTFSLISTP